MGRATQFIEFINEKVIPSEKDSNIIYTHISKNEKLKKIRKEYRKNLKKEKTNESNI
tara:strand:+ start:277 stop:447 length:171 start_codon:yes stop_codon:yes gene_type:complete